MGALGSVSLCLAIAACGRVGFDPKDDAAACTSALATGHSHVCAVMADGTLRCWGHGTHSELGNGVVVDTGIPQTPAGFAFPEALAVGGRHTLAVLGGRLWAWGDNATGQLGDGSTTAQLLPVPTAGEVDWVEVVSTSFGSCGRRSDGSVACWGCTEYLADASVSPHCMTSQTAITDVALAAPARQLAGHQHVCALLADATVWCWGRNDHGQLGNNTTAFSATPVLAFTGATAIAAARRRTCAVRAGDVYCWGDNTNGQIDASLLDRPTATQVTGVSGVDQIALGALHSCALAAGTVYCWGFDKEGELGAGTAGADNVIPSEVVGLTPPIIELSAGSYHTCARDGAGVECWGSNTRGTLGIPPDAAPHPTPLVIPLACL